MDQALQGATGGPGLHQIIVTGNYLNFKSHVKTDFILLFLNL